MFKLMKCQFQCSIGVQVRIVDNDSSTDDNLTLLGPNQVSSIKKLHVRYWEKVTNIEYGNVDFENVIIETVRSTPI